jgi:hypothetical protein
VGRFAEVVEYGVEQHFARVADRFAAPEIPPRFVLGRIIAGGGAPGTTNPDSTEELPGQSFRRAGDRTRTGDVQLGKLAFYH